MNATKTFKNRLSATPNAKTDALTANALLQPDWAFWQRRSYCRIWQAALLSLNIEPTSSNRAHLEWIELDLNDEYIKRREILLVNNGHHEFLPKMEHARAGKTEGEKYVELANVLKLAKHQCWSNIDAFNLGMSPEYRTVIAPHSITQLTDEDEFDIENIKQKAEKYTLVRMGAVLKLFERCLLSEEPDPKRFLKSGKINYAAVGKELAKIIKDAVNDAELGQVYGPPGNARAVSNALEALETFHTSASRRASKLRP